VGIVCLPSAWEKYPSANVPSPSACEYCPTVVDAPSACEYCPTAEELLP